MTENINHEGLDFEPNWMDKMARILLWVCGILVIISTTVTILMFAGVIKWH